MQIVAVAHEARIRPYPHDDERVTAVGAAKAGVTLSGYADLLTVVDPSRHVDVELDA